MSRMTRAQIKELLLNSKIGKLTVISQNKDYTWDCVCECGRHINVKTVKLTHKKVLMCDKCAEKEKKALLDSYIGKQYQNWTIIGRVTDRIYKCKCNCEYGTIREVDIKNLKSGMSKSCGVCSRKKPHENLVGQKFNHLTVVAYANNGKWKCVCDCEHPLKDEIIATTTALKNGDVKSCGHIIYEPKHNKRFTNLLGEKFGKLSVKRELPRTLGEDTKWYCECDCGGSAECTSYNLTSGNSTTCGNCGHINHSGSQAEHDIASLFSEFTVLKDREILEGREIDVYIPELKLGIEYNGSPFHASINASYCDKVSNYHLDKFLLAKAKGVHLINIFDVDWENKRDKIIDYLYSLQGKNKRIYARDCILKTIEKDEASIFIEQYHLQGAFKPTMKINYGLCYDDELVAVMSFGDRRMKLVKEGYYELHRYCVKSGIYIVGGAERLLKAFEREYSPVSLFTYSDNDYFTGGVYARLGFTYLEQCKPDYYWFKNGKELKRQRCQVWRLRKEYEDLYNEAVEKEVSNKENYIMTALKACKVYRSGNTKWEKRY